MLLFPRTSLEQGVCCPQPPGEPSPEPRLEKESTGKAPPPQGHAHTLLGSEDCPTLLPTGWSISHHPVKSENSNSKESDWG